MRLGIRMILVLLIVLALRYLVPPLLGLLMPFALALVVAWVLNPLVKSLQKRLGLSRGVLSLLLILLAFRREDRERWRGPLLAWWGIVAGSALLFLIPRMVSTALEVFFTIAATLLARHIYLRAAG